MHSFFLIMPQMLHINNRCKIHEKKYHEKLIENKQSKSMQTSIEKNAGIPYITWNLQLLCQPNITAFLTRVVPTKLASRIKIVQ